MIGSIEVNVNAANPNLPLPPLFSHVEAPSSLRILNIPRKIGLWEITAVFVTVTYPDNTAISVDAVKSGGVYVATVPGSQMPGKAWNGYEITANGIDEHGDEVSGYCLGRGDVFVLDRDGSITVGETTYYLHIVDEKPALPHKGDLVQTDDGWEIFDGSFWKPFGGGSGSGATVLTVGGGKIYKGGVEMTSYAALLALVQAGGVTLMGTVGADKDALYYPQFCDTNAIRFDATGTLGGDVKTKSYTVQPVNGDHIRVTEGSLVDLAKKTDIPDVVAPASDTAFSKAASAKEIWDKLGAFWLSNTGARITVSDTTGDTELLILNNKSSSSYPDVIVRITATKDGLKFSQEGGSLGGRKSITLPYKDGVFALTDDLSGITAKDIEDFKSKFEGSYDAISEAPTFVNPNPLRFVFVRSENAIYITDTDGPWSKSEKGDANYPTEGLLKLVELYEKNKTILFTDTAFSAQVKKDANYAVVDTIENRSVKRVTISGDTAMTVILPKPTAESGVIDFEVWFDASAYTGTYPSIGYKYPLAEGQTTADDADVITKDGEDLAYGDGAVTIVHFTSVNGSAYTAVAASFK